MSRADFHQELCEVLGSDHVYFTPNENVKLRYPCFVYEFSTDRNFNADDKRYIKREGYDVTVISKDADETFKDDLEDAFLYCEWIRSFVSENLNHHIYKIYY